MELQFEVNKPANFVFEYLTDMQKFVSIHPIISKIDPKGDNTYKVHETLKFGPIPFSFTYPASVEGNLKEQTIKIKATVFGMTKVEMNFKLSPTKNNVTSVTEIVDFVTLLPIKGVLRKIFKTQHTALFKTMNELK